MHAQRHISVSSSVVVDTVWKTLIDFTRPHAARVTRTLELQLDGSVTPPDKKWHLTSEYLRVPTAFSVVEPRGLIHNSCCKRRKCDNYAFSVICIEAGGRVRWTGSRLPCSVWSTCIPICISLRSAFTQRLSLSLMSARPLVLSTSLPLFFSLPCALIPCIAISVCLNARTPSCGSQDRGRWDFRLRFRLSWTRR